MPKGQKPKPTQIKIAEGNRSKVAKDALRPDTPGKGRPRMPMHLSAEERRLWADVVQSLPDSLLTKADEAILERFAVYWSRFREAGRMIAKTGLMVQSPNGPIRNPLLVVQNACAKEMHAAGSEIGLSPVARARMVGQGAEEDDPMELLLGGEEDGAWSTIGSRH